MQIFSSIYFYLKHRKNKSPINDAYDAIIIIDNDDDNDFFGGGGVPFSHEIIERSKMFETAKKNKQTKSTQTMFVCEYSGIPFCFCFFFEFSKIFQFKNHQHYR